MLHCLVHSVLWRELEAAEAEGGARFDAVVSVRNDALWLREFPPRAALAEAAGGADAVLVKACLSWGGLNDKFAVLPRAHAAAWMRLLEAYYDEGYAMYKNSEELQQLIAARHALPVRELHRVFDTVDFYHWGEDDAGRRRCVRCAACSARTPPSARASSRPSATDRQRRAGLEAVLARRRGRQGHVTESGITTKRGRLLAHASAPDLFRSCPRTASASGA